ncbi:cyclohexanecarboxylate-CoA ligase, partial [Streptomyces nigra]
MDDTAHTLGSARTLWDLLAARARRTPDRPALLQDDRALDFGALRERAERVAAG